MLFLSPSSDNFGYLFIEGSISFCFSIITFSFFLAISLLLREVFDQFYLGATRNISNLFKLWALCQLIWPVIFHHPRFTACHWWSWWPSRDIGIQKTLGRNYWQRYCSHLCQLFHLILTTRKQNKSCIFFWTLSINFYKSFLHNKKVTVFPLHLQRNVSGVEIPINSSIDVQLPALPLHFPPSCSHMVIP